MLRIHGIIEGNGVSHHSLWPTTLAFTVAEFRSPAPSRLSQVPTSLSSPMFVELAGHPSRFLETRNIAAIVTKAKNYAAVHGF